MTREFDIAERIDRLCDAFEGEYRAGRVPLIEDYLSRSHEEDRSSLVVELVLLDISYREWHGEAPDFSDYSRRFPNESEALRRCFPLEPDSADRSFDSTITTPAGATAQIAAPVHMRLGRYELVEPLGTGGFGEVWKARDPVLRRWIAIKTLRSDKEFPPPVVEQFLEEGRKLAQLEHPAIVPVHDVGYARDRCYIVSKLIVGETLEDHVKPHARLSASEAAEIVAQIADALHHAHLQGLVHRDIKPSNILLDEQGRPHLTDFGLAISEEEQLDEGPSTVGTYAYMSPEQIRGASDRVDSRSDIYSLGVVLYRLVTGRTPFLGRNRSEWEQQVQSRPPRPPRTIRDDIPAELETICLKCLNKDIEQRYTTAADVAAALRQSIVERSPVVRAKPRRVGIIASAIIAALLVASLIVALRPSRDPSELHEPLPGNAMIVMPTPLMWPHHDDLSVYEILENGRRIDLDCRQYGLLKLSALANNPVEFTVDVNQVRWTGGIGIFFGWGISETDPNEIQLQTVRVCRVFDPDVSRRRLALQRAHMTLDGVTAETTGYFVTGDTYFIEPTLTTNRLSLKFLNGFLESVEWNRAACPPLTQYGGPTHWAAADETGPIGVFAVSTSGTFSNPRIDGASLIMAPAVDAQLPETGQRETALRAAILSE